MASHNKPKELWSNRLIKQKINDVHQNPVESGLVLKAEDFIHSSPREYAGNKLLLDGIMVFEFFDFLLSPHETIRNAAGTICIINIKKRVQYFKRCVIGFCRDYILITFN